MARLRKPAVRDCSSVLWLREAKPSRVLDVVRTETPINAEGGETRSMLVTVGVLYEE